MSRLDEWLGRAPLKARIEELEAEAERLRERYEAESERRSEAVRERQAAEERGNRLEDRIAQLEDEVERAKRGADGSPAGRRDRLRGARLDDALDRLRSFRAEPEGALTATVPDAGSVPAALPEVLEERATLVGEDAPCLVCADDRGLLAVTLDPPLLPAIEPRWTDRFELRAEWFRPTGSFHLALVRADLFAIGRYEGAERRSFDGFESDVMGTHSKGGFSQARFERRRDGQVGAHLEDAREAIRAAVSTDAPDDRPPLYLTGQAEAIDRVADGLDPAPDATRTVDATGEPEPALDDAFRSFWTTGVRVV